jgi:putative FmdB family regulatory protein
MPIYEYRCSSCGHQQEFLLKVSDAPLTVCTACGKETFSKMVTAAGFQLKGSGWYATDFKNRGAAPAKAPAKGDAGSAGEGKAADAKPAEGGDAKAKAPGAAASTTSGGGEAASSSTAGGRPAGS